VDVVLGAAHDARASDVHFEPVESGLDVRFRLDGALHTVAAVPREISASVVARLKVLAGLATYRTDVPQDGRIAGGAADLRLSTYPTVRGEKAVVRLFAARPEDFRLDSLGLGDDARSALEKALSCREGLVVLTGPAGSGKTTTIYAAIQHVRDGAPRDVIANAGGRPPAPQIVTIEDPVECLLPGVTQTETNPAAGLTLANCLRSVLRQDPEVIMVGEIRDPDAAHLAVEAALTGHLVVTTLHAGTAAGVFARLLEMGLAPHMITSVVRASLAQRLVRRLCPECRTTEGAAWTAPGCESCLGTGFRGRLPLAEILTLAPAVRDRVLERADLEELERAARESGMAPLEERGRALVGRGETTEGELARVLAGSRG
jgi:type II secretory ATPase GspE/PulE/Tfp pilus assembly ATPase PilB-like protein